MVRRISNTTRDRFMVEVNAELLKFERREGELRRIEREERAAKLQLPLDKFDSRDGSWRRNKILRSEL
jgi:hypothetical protein